MTPVVCLDSAGRCCGRKPLHYKGGSWRSPERPMKFCDRCCREYDPETGVQRENWAWKLDTNEFGQPSWIRRR